MKLRYFKRKRRVASGRPSSGSTRSNPSSGKRPSSFARLSRLANRLSGLASPVFRELCSLSWPIAAAMLGDTALGLVDTKITGGLGAAALGGVGMGTVLMYLLYSLAYGTFRAVKVRTSHAVGEGMKEKGFSYARAGVLMGLGYGLLVAFVMRDSGALLRLVGADPTLVPYGEAFLRALAFGAPATCAVAALVQHRQALGDVRTTMMVGLGGNLVNAILATCLVYGKLGLPALGVAGAGYSTAIVETLELAVLFALLLRDERLSKKASPLRLGEATREVVTLGVPTGIQFTGEILAFSTFTAILGQLGAHEIAAHQIAFATIRVSFLPGIAIAEATSVLVGRKLGERKLAGADEVTRAGLVLGMSFMALCGVGFALFGGALARFFSSDPRVVHTAIRLLWVAAIFQLLDAANIVLRGALRGAKDVAGVAVIGIAVTWACIPTAAYVLGKQLGMGALGGWIGFVGETTFSALFCWMRWKKGSFRDAYRSV